MSATRDEQLADFLGRARWFGGKGRGVSVSGVHRVLLPTSAVSDPTKGSPDEPVTTIELVSVAYADGGTDLYQLPLALYDAPVERLEHALVGRWDDDDLGPVVAYDAVHDRDATRAFQVGFNRAETTGEVVFHRLVGHELDLSTYSTLFSGEQSNSSIAFGDDSLMKVFRRLTPGVNPDIEIHAALTEAGNQGVAELYGWLEAPSTEPGGEPLQLAMLQQFLRTASDGWDHALTSVRNLFAEGDLHPDEVGGDFAGEATRLGAAVAEVHAVLRDHFPTAVSDPASIASAMRARFAEARAIAPELDEHAETVHAIYDRLAEVDEELVAQRVHGDLHLGQTLRVTRGWKLVDFEGEPARSLAERRLPDSPWRDVAGMLRSFDYAARSVEQDLRQDADMAAQTAYRAQEWVRRNRDAFLAGYVEQQTGTAVEEGSALSATEQLLADAYEADKAVYEVTYEARNRPDWIHIPLGALARLAGPSPTGPGRDAATGGTP